MRKTAEQPIDLEFGNPIDLAQSASLDDIWRTVKDKREFTEDEGRMLENIYQSRTIALLRSRTPKKALMEELRKLSHHLSAYRAPPRSRSLNNLILPYATRWSAYEVLLGHYLVILSAPDTAAKSLFDYAHVENILRTIAKARPEGLKQADLCAILELGKSNATRVLKLMEANDLIERQRQGNENTIFLTELARDLLEIPAQDAEQDEDLEMSQTGEKTLHKYIRPMELLSTSKATLT